MSASQRGNQRVSECKGKACFASAERELIGDRKGGSIAQTKEIQQMYEENEPKTSNNP